MTEGIQTFADYRQTYKAKHYIHSLKHVNKVLKLAQEKKKALGKMNKYM
jgi:predicted metal-dependent HD superfamily phosphohydrolase